MEELHRENPKKRSTIGYVVIIEHFGSANPYKKDDAQQQKFMKDLLFVAKTYMLISVVESQWLRHLVMWQNPQIVFSNRKQMVKHANPSLVAKTME